MKWNFSFLWLYILTSLIDCRLLHAFPQSANTLFLHCWAHPAFRHCHPIVERNNSEGIKKILPIRWWCFLERLLRCLKVCRTCFGRSENAQFCDVRIPVLEKKSISSRFSFVRLPSTNLLHSHLFLPCFFFFHFSNCLTQRSKNEWKMIFSKTDWNVKKWTKWKKVEGDFLLLFELKKIVSLLISESWFLNHDFENRFGFYSMNKWNNKEQCAYNMFKCSFKSCRWINLYI